MSGKHCLKIVPRRTRRTVPSALILAVAGVMASADAWSQVAFEDVSVAAGFGATGSETWGASWGDLDADGYPDLFCGNHRNRASLHRNNRDGTFTNVSEQVDLSRTSGWTGGRANVDTHAATWADIDNDGDDDLYESVSLGDDNLFINDAGYLTNRKLDYGLHLLSHNATRQGLFLDYNGDGRLDLASIALRRSAFAPQLADGRFGNGPDMEVPISCSSDGQWAHLADVHPTPGLELLCAPRMEAYPKSVTAFAGGTAIDVTAGFPRRGPVNDAVTLDADGDLRPDLYMVLGSERPSDAYQASPDRFEAQFITAARRTKSVKFKTTGILTVTASLREGSDPQGNPDFIDVGASSWSPTSLVFALDPKDARNTGIGTGSPGINIGYLAASKEWLVTQGNAEYSYSYVQVRSTAPITELRFAGASGSDLGYRPVLLRNTPDGFTEATDAGFDATVRCQSAAAGDFDNDMDEDLFLVCSGGAHNVADRLYVNDGRGRFTELSGAGGASGRIGAAVGDKAGTGESVVTADYDLDGFLDLLVTNGNNMRPLYLGGPKQLFRNLGNSNHWIELDLVGTSSNRDGLGSQVYVSAGGTTQYREQNGGYHRWSQHFRRLHIGLGSQAQADVRVRWPDGTETNHAGLAADEIYRIRQDGTATPLPRHSGGGTDTDTDGDGLSDAREAAIGTDPTLADTDADGLDDGAEISRMTRPLLSDSDGDGLRDGDEVHLYRTNPLAKNTDADGLSDRVEIVFKRTDPLNPDTDGDGLTDGREAGANGLGTSPLKADTDGGGVDDGLEVQRGTNPLKAADDV